MATNLLVEAEHFDDFGGWKLDTQFIHIMGSPYLLAHGMGKPVDNAKTTVSIPDQNGGCSSRIARAELEVSANPSPSWPPDCVWWTPMAEDQDCMALWKGSTSDRIVPSA